MTLTSHPGHSGDHQRAPMSVHQQRWPGAPANTYHSITSEEGERAPCPRLSRPQTTIWFSCQLRLDQTRIKFKWQSCKEFLFKYFKRNHTQESHMAREKMLCCWSFLFSIDKLHIFMFLPKYTVIIYMHYYMCSIRAVKLKTRHEISCLQSSLLFTFSKFIV